MIDFNSQDFFSNDKCAICNKKCIFKIHDKTIDEISLFDTKINISLLNNHIKYKCQIDLINNKLLTINKDLDLINKLLNKSYIIFEKECIADNHRYLEYSNHISSYIDNNKIIINNIKYKTKLIFKELYGLVLNNNEDIIYIYDLDGLLLGKMQNEKNIIDKVDKYIALL